MSGVERQGYVGRTKRSLNFTENSTDG